MPPSVVRWTFHSPLRLLVVSAAVAAVLIGGVALAGSQASSPAPPAPKPHRMATQVPATPSPTVQESTPSERTSARDLRRATNAARAFVDTWTRGSEPHVSRKRWLRQIEPLTTDALYRGLRMTDLARLPGGRVRRVRAVAVGAFSADFTATLTSGLQLGVKLVAEGGRWAVSDIRLVGG